MLDIKDVQCRKCTNIDVLFQTPESRTLMLNSSTFDHRISASDDRYAPSKEGIKMEHGENSELDKDGSPSENKERNSHTKLQADQHNESVNRRRVNLSSPSFWGYESPSQLNNILIYVSQC